MLGIIPRSLSALRIQLGASLEQVPAECRDQLSTLSPVTSNVAEHVPSLQLSYDEIPATELDRLLGHAGISSSNAPVGLDADFLPRTVGADPRTQFLFFPLVGLEKHLTAEEPHIANLFRAADSMDAFVKQRGNAISAVEYLTAGLLTCIQFCRTSKHALIITW